MCADVLWHSVQIVVHGLPYRVTWQDLKGAPLSPPPRLLIPRASFAVGIVRPLMARPLLSLSAVIGC